ncbi:hypothetical protein IU954_003942 [Salmonella enterica subsp. enterica serovar Typhimurium]|nr:hypothetical protein [Salmonella enterica subsp. enterica serovar Typhimurium]
MLGGADNPNGELPSYITGADIVMLFALLLLTKKPGILPGFVVLISE